MVISEHVKWIMWNCTKKQYHYVNVERRLERRHRFVMRFMIRNAIAALERFSRTTLLA